jgi:hypothetical protein
MMAKIQAKKLSDEETREILTPLAFKIDKSLFGISLAVPWRRGMALLVDLFLVALLSGAPGELLAFLVAITLFKLGSRKRGDKLAKKSALSKIILRVFAALIVFVVLIDILPKLFAELDTFNSHVEQAGQSQGALSSNKNNQSHLQSNAENMAEPNTNSSEDNDFIKVTLTLAAGIAISQTDCVDYSCWLQLCESLSSAYNKQTASTLEINKFNAYLLESVAEQSRLSHQEITQLSVQLEQLHLATQIKPPLIKHKVEKKFALTGAEKSNTTSEINTNKHTVAVPSSSSVYKGFAWLQGLVEDLGLGFGWAAFYFTMFTALWYGQTPGKKLFSIRVIQLDGTPLSIWDSFGRYGGYGAGIATGLLGFAQIFWDPNRQAIHDKISATIVVNDTESKISRTNTAEQTAA